MTPDDAAAYAALNLPPGAALPAVTDAWRHLVKLYHPDLNPLLGAHERRRLLEVNAAYERLRALPRAAADGRVALEGPPVTRSRAWEQVWDVRSWPAWVPGVSGASAVKGTCDRRAAVEGLWGGRRVAAVVVFCGMTPWRRIALRVLELRVGKQIVALPAAPSVCLRFKDDRTLLTVDLPPDAPAVLREGVALMSAMALRNLLGGPPSAAAA